MGIVKRTGDGSLFEFRVGIHLGDVVVESDGDLMGDGVTLLRDWRPSPIRRDPGLRYGRDALAAVSMFAPVTGSKKYTLFISNSKGRRSPSLGKSSGLTRVTA
jgi:hypothetical protein